MDEFDGYAEHWVSSAPQATGLKADFRIHAWPSVFTGDWSDRGSWDDPLLNTPLPNLSFRESGETNVRVEDALANIGAYAEYFQTLLDVKRKSGRSLSDIGNYTRFHTKMMTSEPAFACDLR